MKCKTLILTILLSIFLFFSWNCDRLLVSTTTSVDNTGLLDYLKPVFEDTNEFNLQWIAQGTGQAIETAKNGDCDVIIVHNRDLEREFLEEGYGDPDYAYRIMYNFFVLVGPESDPAGIKNSSNIIEGFEKIYGSDSQFISRGDNSGTNLKELSIWEMADIDPSDWENYIETGKGMGKALTHADEVDGYILSDRATFLAYQDKVDLVILLEDPDNLKNVYSIIAVNPEKYGNVNYEGAKALVDFFISDEAQERILSFQKDGEVLFHPFVEKWEL